MDEADARAAEDTAEGRRDDLRRAAVETTRQAGVAGSDAFTFLLEVLLAPLPAPWTAGLTGRLRLDYNRAGIISGLMQVGLFAALWALGYVAWIHGMQADIVAEAEATQATSPLDRETQVIVGYTLLSMNPVLTLIFTFTTARGFLMLLFGLGGFARFISAVMHRENAADPTLSAVETGRSLLLGRVATAQRERAKGERTPDVLHGGGERLGYDLRIVSCEDYPWNEGNGVIVDRVPHRLVAKRQVTDESGKLRMQYDLMRLAASEVMRGVRQYQPTEPPVAAHRGPPSRRA